MQPVKITLFGNFYDCQIYRGRLYLWGFDGILRVYDWNGLVNSRIENEIDRIAATFCFLDGNYLYKSSLIELFNDNEFKELLIKKFNRVMNMKFQISTDEMRDFLIGEQMTPKNVLPTDTEIYKNDLYFIVDEGLFCCSAHRPKNKKYPVSSRPDKLWDCDLLSIKANKYPQIALSGGSEGLFELNMNPNIPTNLQKIEDFGEDIYKISDKHSVFANYSYLSIYNSSSVDNSFLAKFEWNKDNKDHLIRGLSRLIAEEEIFNESKQQNYLSWGIGDKIYKAKEGGFDIIKYNPFAKDEKHEKEFKKMNSIQLAAWKGKVINGGTAYFGNIVECENALVVVMSDNNTMTIPGPITRWRVYPRSLNYENHLHVILDDKIEIYSFVQDYFVNQDEKTIGIKYSETKHAKNRPVSYFNQISEEKYSEN